LLRKDLFVFLAKKTHTKTTVAKSPSSSSGRQDQGFFLTAGK
jgi:hypothetical protein